MLKVLCSVGGQCTERAYVSWLIVGGGFGGHCVFHNDMEQLLDMHARGHPALSLLIPDSSFSPDPRRNLRRGGWGYDQRRVDGPPHTHTLTLTCWLITLSHAAALIYCLRFVLELLNFFHIYKQLFSSNKHAPHPHHPWPWSQQTTKFLFFFALLKSGEDDSLRILIRLCVCMSLCVSVWVIFTSNSVKLNGKAKWYMYIVQLYNNKVSVWLEYLFIIFLNA